jgi:hypothetical protein
MLFDQLVLWILEQLAVGQLAAAAYVAAACVAAACVAAACVAAACVAALSADDAADQTSEAAAASWDWG